MRKYFVAAVIAVSASAGSAQNTATIAENPVILQGNMKRAFDEVTSAARPQEWQTINPDASIDEIIRELTNAGWDAAETRMALSASGANQYDLRSMTPAPGIKAFLAVPREGSGAAVEFSPPLAGSVIQPAFFGTGPTAAEIRQEILDGMQAAVDALCGMRARPSSIRAQASAFGVVEVEATWDAAEVCD